MVETKDDQKAIGMSGILNRADLENPDIGFAYLPAFNGKGYAYEMASAIMKYVSGELNIPKISAITLPGNASSIRLLEKIGLSYVKPFSFPDSNEELLLYSN